MFPLHIINAEPAPPPGVDQPAPNYVGDDYPGFAKFTPCGQVRSGEAPWDQTLAEEIEYWHENLSVFAMAMLTS